MATTITKSIGSAGGRDYTNVANFLVAAPSNLVTADEVWVGECYNDSEFTGVDASFTVSGKTTDATRYIKITAASGQSFQDDASVRTNPLQYDQSKGVGFNLTALSTVIINNSNVILDRIQFKRTANNSGSSVVSSNLATGSTNIVVKNCILQNEVSGPTYVYIQFESGNYGINLAIIDKGSGTTSGANLALGSSTLLNCTIVQSTANAAHGSGIAVSYATSLVVRNCAVFGFTTTWNGTPGGANTNYNCSDGTCPTGANNQNGKTYANQFVSTTADWRLKSGADCIGTGNTDASLAPNDISNFARGATTAGDSSAWEYSAASSGTLASINGLVVADIASVNSVAVADLASFNGLTF